MRFEDDTPDDGALPARYPKHPPHQLLSDPRSLAPTNLFALEGLDGAGKSTLVAALTASYQDRGRRITVRKLGGSELIRHALPRAKWLNADPACLQFLNWVSLYHQFAVLAPELNGDGIILFDRYALSVKIRGILEGLKPEFVERLGFAIPRPAATIVLDCDPEVCLARILASGRGVSYFESGARDVDHDGDPERSLEAAPHGGDVDRPRQFLEHQARLRTAYRAVAAGDSSIHIVDASGPVEQTLQRALPLLDGAAPAAARLS